MVVPNGGTDLSVLLHRLAGSVVDYKEHLDEMEVVTRQARARNGGRIGQYSGVTS
jgi:hypothetical protein